MCHGWIGSLQCSGVSCESAVIPALLNREVKGLKSFRQTDDSSEEGREKQPIVAALLLLLFRTYSKNM